MSKNLRLCLIAPELLPNWGGVGTYCIELSKALSDYVEVHVATLERENKGKPIYSERDIIDFFDGKVDVHVLAKASVKDTFFYNVIFQVAVLKKFPRLAKEHDFDLFHSNFPQMPDILLRTRGVTKIPNLTTIHTTIEGQKDGIRRAGLSFFEMDRSEKFTLLLYPSLVLAERLYVQRIDNVVTVSNWMKQIIKKAFCMPCVISVIHNGVDANKFSPHKEQFSELLEDVSNPIVLFSSRLTMAKGVQYLIRSIPSVLKESKEVHFVFTGAGLKRPWVNLLKKLGVKESSYTFLGYVDYKLLPAIYAKADIFVAPTLYDNFPFRVLEAMSSQTSVVASNICGIPEMITHGKNGILIPPADSNSLAETLLLLLKDDKMRRKLARNARQTIVEKFTWRKISEKLLDVYKRIVSDSHN